MKLISKNMKQVTHHIKVASRKCIANSFTLILLRKGRKKHGWTQKDPLQCLFEGLVTECRKGYKTPNRKSEGPCHCLFGFDCHTDKIVSPKLKTPADASLLSEINPLTKPNSKWEIPIPKLAPALSSLSSPWLQQSSCAGAPWASRAVGELCPSTAHFSEDVLQVCFTRLRCKHMQAFNITS